MMPMTNTITNLPYTEFIATVDQHMHTVGTDDADDKHYHKLTLYRVHCHSGPAHAYSEYR